MINRLRDETGLGLPLAMGVLLIVMGLAAWSVSVADQLHRSSERDRGAKRALGPADAGVQRAAWRLAQTTPSAVSATQCVVSSTTGDTVATAAANGSCPAAPVATSMGNGSSYSYTVTGVLPPGATCAGETVAAGTYTRCVTATGTSNGVPANITRRVQTRLRATVVPLFPPVGVVGEDHVRINNNDINFRTCPGDPGGIVGSNGLVSTVNEVHFDAACGPYRQSWSISVAPGAPNPTYGGGTTPNPVPTVPRSQPWALPDIAPWPTAADDNNESIVAGGGVVWSAATRDLTLTTNLTLGAGTYVFCSLYLGNGGRIILAGGAKVKIYIDSPTRPGSGCAAGTGFLRAQNSNGINWPGGNDDAKAAAARNLHIFAYGNMAYDDNSSLTQCGESLAWGSIILCRSGNVAGVLYAPNARVFLNNGVEWVGAIAAWRVGMNNTVTFRFPSGLDDGTGGTAGAYQAVRWTECPSTGTGTSC